MALYAPNIHGAERLDAVGGIAQRHGYQNCESGQRCSKGHYSEVELLTRTLLEPTRTRGAEQALLASPEICFGTNLAPWSTVVICDCQRAISMDCPFALTA